MVTDAVLDWWFNLCTWFMNLLPNDTSPLANFNLSWLTDMDYFLPIHEMFGVWLGLVSLGGTFAGTSLLIWVIVGIIRGGQTKA